MIELYEGERVDEVNDKIKLIQKTDGLTFGTDAYLLSAFAKGGSKQICVDLGSGTGVIVDLVDPIWEQAGSVESRPYDKYTKM